MSMTENEAIGQLKYMYKTCMDEKCKHKGQCDLCCESKDMAIQALEEIQQYRAIGTIGEFEALKEKSVAYLTDKEKRLLFSALSREKEICKQVDKECCREPYEDTLESVVKELEKKFYYGRFEKEIRNIAIDEFAERLKAILKDMQILSMRGEDDCPHDDCPYSNQSITCEYCIREQTIKDIEQIAEELKESNNE